MTWWWEGNRLERAAKGLLIAAAYAVACWTARKISLDQFYLPAGVRLAALLLIPPRAWGYLVIGEYTYFAQMRIPMIEKYGLPWVILASASLMPTVALIVRNHLKKIEEGSDAWVLSAAATSAVAVTVLNVSLSHYLWNPPSPNPVSTELVRYAVGDYVGMLTVVPLALLWKRRAELAEESQRFANSATAAIAIMLAVGVAAAIVPREYKLATSLMQASMALPAIALTCRFGWKGAALSVPLINLLIGLTASPWSSPYWAFDPSMFITQQILAVAGTAMLCMGSSISHYYNKHQEVARREQISIAHARTAHISAEMELKKRVLSMVQVGDGIDHSLSEIAYWLSENGHDKLAEDIKRISVANSRCFREQTSMVYPTALEHIGLYLTLQVSGIASEWERTNRILSPRLVGDPCKLTVGLQLAAYRLMTEATSLLIGEPRGYLRITARCGRISSTQWTG